LKIPVAQRRKGQRNQENKDSGNPDDFRFLIFDFQYSFFLLLISIDGAKIVYFYGLGKMYFFYKKNPE